jgi:hypothetical protein
MEPHRGGGIPLHGLVIWDGWVLMLPGVFAALVLATALALNGPGEALWAWVQAQLAPDPWRARWDDAVLRHHGSVHRRLRRGQRAAQRAVPRAGLRAEVRRGGRAR